ncbi:MAG: rhomboid family intramembrane serine protease [Nibricoccus sp.]
MSTYETSDEHRPVMWLRGYPVYAAHFIVLVFVMSAIVTTALNLLKFGGLLNGLAFSNSAVLQGEVWRLVSYGFVNVPSLGFAVDMVMLVWFGREVERSVGRRSFLLFYAGIYLLTPLLLTVVGVWYPLQPLVGETGAFAMFIAFATFFPNAPVLFTLLAKWVAVILVGIYTLIALNNRDFVGLLSLWATTGFAFAFVRYQQGRIELPKVNLFKRRPKLRVLPDLPSEKKTPARQKESPTSSMAEVDALLDKIAQTGIGSLTAKERAKLDAARAELLKRASGRD